MPENSLMKDRNVIPPADTIVNVTPDGAAPKRRVQTVDAARSVFDDCVLDQEGQAKARARIRGLVDGNPPWNPEELRRRGQSWRTNVNFREAEAIIDTNSSALWEMQQDLFVLSRFTPVDPKSGYSPENGLDYGQILAEEYTKVLRASNSFAVFTDLVIHDAMETGMGAAVWCDPESWKPKWFNISNFVFPKNARCEIDQLDFFFVRDEIDLGMLFRVIADESKAKSIGWNVEQVKALLIRLFGTGDRNASGSPEDVYQMSPWESVQQQIKNYDSNVQRRQFEGLKIVRMFVRELDSPAGVTQYIFEEDDSRSAGIPATDNLAGSSAPAENPDKFLFEKVRQFESMDRAIWWLLYSYGDGFLRSVKGLGHRITPHCELSNRFIGQTFDAGIMSSSLVLQPTAGSDAQKLQIMRVGPITYIPEHAQPINTAFSPRIDGLIMLRDMSTSILNNNTGVFKARGENPLRREGDKTARQVMAEESKEARFEKNQAAFFYAQWDFLHKEIARRLMSRKYAESSLPLDGKEEAKTLRDACIARGVPEVLLDPKLWCVKAERAVGMGSPGMRLDITGQLLSIKGMLPEENQVHVVREYIAARTGSQHVDRFMPLKPKDIFTSDAASIATLENNDFAEGSWVPVGSDQLHGTHIRVHFVPLVQIAEVLGQEPGKIDPRKAYPVFANAIPHIQQHLAYMERDHLPEDTDRRAKFKEYLKLFKQMREVMTNLEIMVRNLEKKDQQRQIQQQKEMQALRDEIERQQVEVEKHKIDKQFELKKYEADLLNQARQSKSDTSIAVAVRRAMADMANKAQLTQAQVASVAQKTAADVQAKAAKAAVPRSGG